MRQARRNRKDDFKSILSMYRNEIKRIKSEMIGERSMFKYSLQQALEHANRQVKKYEHKLKTI